MEIFTYENFKNLNISILLVLSWFVIGDQLHSYWSINLFMMFFISGLAYLLCLAYEKGKSQGSDD